ncbi:MAG: DNA-directed RNA polymerase subunit A' [Candidatus Nanohaloarchaeota archaeon QJJ-5]|nr:DNA-directed RNA polymerase subunit A' [Candidatus Nanohaloarchaeota archaeon QJJ-5]
MRQIESLNFGLMSPEKVENLSVKRIKKAEVYDADGYPVEDGVMDPSLGVLDPGMVCRTCGGRMRDCKGHFGHITLSKPVVNVLYAKKVRNLLRFTCEECKALLVKDEDKSLRKSNRKTTCPECDHEQPEIDLDKPYSYYKDDEDLKPTEIKEWLEEIPDENAAVLGVEGGRPEWLIIDKVLVPPVTIRPSITLESGQRSEDDLTHKLVDVIRINQRLRNNIEIEAPDFIIDDLWELLQYHVATLYDNDLSGVPPARHRSGRSLKSLIERLKGKEGRFRQNLIGKRANFSARTVISPDPNIGINEVGVPDAIAKDMTIPVKVKEDNIEEVKEYIRNGPNTHPGANYVFRPDGSRKRITEDNADDIIAELETGYEVERHLMDGDTVLFNRQPSLHRMSIMAHEVKVMPYRTFRLNLAVCPPYNADFDGDEMNLHVAQTEEARAEAEELLKVQNHIKSPKFGGPLIGMMQDHISGLFLLSDEDGIPRQQAYDMLVAAGAYDKDLPDGETISGKELISLFIPEGISLEEGDTVIEDGELIEGRIDEDLVADYGGELINQILMEYGEDRTVEFLNTATRLGIKYLDRRGFSISTSDLEITDDGNEQIQDRIEEGREAALDLLEQYERGEIDALTGKTEKETLEVKMVSTLREISTDVEEIVDEDVQMTSARVMAESGARGSMTNLAVMTGLLGQETIRGERISRGFKQRSLPHYQKEDLSPRARGFVQSAIYTGLDPDEMFYEVMSGREGLMDQSLRTRTSGYMYRRISNAMQDLSVEYDRTVRAADGTIVQFTAGEDGIDPQKSNWGELTR